MKRRKLAVLLLVAPLALLSACGNGVSTLNMTANWYANALGDVLSGTQENLVYTVTFEAPQTPPAFSADFDEGVYTTSLTAESLTFNHELIDPSDRGKSVYHYHTELSVTGRYSVNGQTGEDFENSVVNDVWFFGVKDGLRPVRSVRKVKNSAPDLTAESAAEAGKPFEYTLTTVYNTALTRATVTFDDLLDDKNDQEQKNIKIGGSGTFLDDAQIVFALRSLDLSSAASFRSLNPVKRNNWAKAAVASTRGAASVFIAEEITIGGKAQTDVAIPAHSVSLAYSATYAGGAQTLTYAQKGEGINAYRNVLLHQISPLPYGLGNLVFELSKADFSV